MKTIPLLLAVLFCLAGCGSTNKSERLTSYSGEACPEILESDEWKSTGDAPRYGDALVARVLGQRDVSNYITGGVISRKTLFDWNGNAFSEFTNANGETVKVINSFTGCPIGRGEYSDRRVFFTQREKAPGYRYK